MYNYQVDVTIVLHFSHGGKIKWPGREAFPNDSNSDGTFKLDKITSPKLLNLHASFFKLITNITVHLMTTTGSHILKFKKLFHVGTKR